MELNSRELYFIPHRKKQLLQTSAAKVTKNLAELDDWGKDFIDSYSELEYVEVEELAKKISKSVSDSLEATKLYGNSRQVDFPREYLAYQVAGDYYYYLGKMPTKTHSGENDYGKDVEGEFSKCLKEPVPYARVFYVWASENFLKLF